MTIYYEGFVNVTLDTLRVNGTSLDILLANVFQPLPKDLTIIPGATTIIEMQIGTQIPIVQDNQLTIEVLCKEGRLSTPVVTITVGA